MGVHDGIGPGRRKLSDRDYSETLKELWKQKDLPSAVNDCAELLKKGKIKNLFIFGEDPAGCALEPEKVKKWFDAAGFVVVQDYFMTETAVMADLVLPASLPSETGGSFTNTQGVIQQFSGHFDVSAGLSNCDQLAGLLERLGSGDVKSEVSEIRDEVFSLLAKSAGKEEKYLFRVTGNKNQPKMFIHGCDNLVKRFDKDFEKAFEN